MKNLHQKVNTLHKKIHLVIVEMIEGDFQNQENYQKYYDYLGEELLFEHLQ